MDTTSAVHSDTPTCLHYSTRFDKRTGTLSEHIAYSVAWVDLVISAQAMTIEAMIIRHKRLFWFKLYTQKHTKTVAQASRSLTNKPVRCIWAAHEKRKSSTWRELDAVRWGIKSSQDEMTEKAIEWFTDYRGLNGVVSILKHDSSNRQLQNNCSIISNEYPGARANWQTLIVDFRIETTSN